MQLRWNSCCAERMRCWSSALWSGAGHPSTDWPA